MKKKLASEEHRCGAIFRWRETRRGEKWQRHGSNGEDDRRGNEEAACFQANGQHQQEYRRFRASTAESNIV